MNQDRILVFGILPHSMITGAPITSQLVPWRSGPLMGLQEAADCVHNVPLSVYNVWLSSWAIPNWLIALNLRAIQPRRFHKDLFMMKSFLFDRMAGSSVHTLTTSTLYTFHSLSFWSAALSRPVRRNGKQHRRDNWWVASHPLIHNQFLYLVITSLFLCESKWMASGRRHSMLSTRRYRCALCVLPFDMNRPKVLSTITC